ncbi:hypothetical protein BH23ACT11_BH23ACT11_06460 [soil metagenome]
MPELIHLVPYDSDWPARFEEERDRIEAVIGRWVIEIEHVGSTAIPGLDAKPVVDIMVGLRSMADADCCVEPLVGLGYSYWADGAEPHHRLFVNFIDAERTARTHNLHLVQYRGWYWTGRLLFRDHLIADPKNAQEYAQLKRELAERFREDREAYTAAKTEFVAAVVERAKKSQA